MTFNAIKIKSVWHSIRIVLNDSGYSAVGGIYMQTGPNKSIFIAGMGPAGLASAIEAARKGYDVIIADPRVEMIRGQRVQIDANTLRFLESLRSDDKKDTKFFDHKISRNGEVTVELKDVQRYLAYKLALYPNISIRPGFAITRIDPHKQQVTIENKSLNKEEHIDFNHFVAADGARHEVANLLNQSSDSPEFKVIYDPIPEPYQPRHPESGTIALTLAPGHKIPVKPAQAIKFKLSDMERLKKYGWQEPFYPKVYILHNKDNSKLFVSGEIPKNIYEMTDKDHQKLALVGWGKLMANMLYGYQPSDFVLIEKKSKKNPAKAQAKNKLKTTVFPLRLHAARDASLLLGQGGSFTLVGDANKNANFFFSHGVNDAILDAQHFAKNLNDVPNAHFNMSGYRLYQARQLEKHFGKLKMLNEPSDMPLVIQEISALTLQSIDMALGLSKSKFNTEVSKVKGHLADMQAQIEVQGFYFDFRALLKVMNEYLETKTQKSGKLLKSIFGDTYAKKIQHLETIAKNAERQFQKYYDLNAKRAKEENVRNIVNSLDQSVRGSILLVSSRYNSAEPSNSSSSSSSKYPSTTHYLEDAARKLEIRRSS